MKNYLVLPLMFLCVACGGDKKYKSDQKAVAEVVGDSFYAEVIAFQKELDAQYKDPETSPLYDRHRVDFEGLDYYAPNEKFSLWASFELTPDTIPFMLATTTDRQTEERVYGIARFKIDEKEYQLELYQSSDLMKTTEYANYLFLPFTDLTNAKTTYGGGRYIDLRIPDSDSILIDFNKAYNPYCAYNSKYSCPKVPKQNHLELAVEAGVKKWDRP